MKSIEIEKICQAIEPSFWVPGVGGKAIEVFVGFVLTNNLVETFKARQGEEDFSLAIEEVCHAVDPRFHVIGVGNRRIGEFVKLANTHNLWEQFK